MSPFSPPAPKFTLPPPSKDGKPPNANNMPSYVLSNGASMPVVGYGTFRAAPGDVSTALKQALQAGYRHLDFAHVYGNEKEIGRVLRQAFADGLVTREELFITGKLWNSDHDAEIVPQAAEYSLSNLGLDYFDLYLIHFPICWKHTGLATPSWGASELGETPLIDTWRAMEKLVDNGKAKAIGVSNYPLMLLHDLVCQARIPVACNQIEVHAYYTRDSLVNYCASRNICVVAHTPLGGGLLNKETWNYDAPLESPVIQGIADKHNVSPAQVLLRFLLQRGIVVIPKSVQPARMQQNIHVFGFGLTDDEMQHIAALDKYVSYKTNPNPIDAVVGGPDQFASNGTDIFD